MASDSEEWSVERQSNGFAVRAGNADRYVQENLGRIRRDDPRKSAAQTMVDMSSAEGDLCRMLASSGSLQS